MLPCDKNSETFEGRSANSLGISINHQKRTKSNSGALWYSHPKIWTGLVMTVKACACGSLLKVASYGCFCVCLCVCALLKPTHVYQASTFFSCTRHIQKYFSNLRWEENTIIFGHKNAITYLICQYRKSCLKAIRRSYNTYAPHIHQSGLKSSAD